jgi:hypothetical protein
VGEAEKSLDFEVIIQIFRARGPEAGGFFVLFLVGLGFVLRTSSLQNRLSTP